MTFLYCRWSQVSLREILVGVTLVCVVFVGWLAFVVRHAEIAEAENLKRFDGEPEVIANVGEPLGR